MHALTDKIQQAAARVNSHLVFRWTVIAVIVLTVILIGLNTYPLPHRYISQLELLDLWIKIFFIIEIFIRLFAAGSFRRFFSHGWNVFDFLIVAASLLPLENSEYVLLGRLVRVFRILLLFNAIPQLNLILRALLASMLRVGYISLMLVIIFYTFGVLGSLLFSQIDPFLWGNVGLAMLTLLRIITGDDWTVIMYQTMEQYPWSWLYYLLFIFLSGAVFLNMLIGVLVDAIQHQMKNKSASSDEEGKDNR